MKNIFAYFASTRYWKDAKELEKAYLSLSAEIGGDAYANVLMTESDETTKLPSGDFELVVIPMSGAVQANILAAAKLYDSVTVYAAYVQGNCDATVADLMLMHNAAPTFMDCWSVLRRTHPRAFSAVNREQLSRRLNVLAAYRHMRGAKLLLIGEIEPWVISASRDLNVYKRLGVTIEQVPQSEVAELYRETGDDEGERYASRFKSGASDIVEPSDEDIKNAGRMAAALIKVLERHNADGMAIACFNLLSEGTTACLGVSYINDQTDKFAACEGDLDSACTMLMMKSLTKTKLWMANPALHPGGDVNFSHCTAPIEIAANQACPYILRSHHESGIGACVQVELPKGRTLTACRISDNASKVTIQNGISIDGEYENCCRTQLYIRFDDFDRYLNTALGCHQVFAFEDISQELTMLAELLQLEVL